MASLADISNSISEKLIQSTLKTFQRFYEQELTRSDAIEIIESLTSLSETLLEIENNSETSLSKVINILDKSIQKLEEVKLLDKEEFK